jgi:outer membrane protein assembly factor BamA
MIRPPSFRLLLAAPWVCQAAVLAQEPALPRAEATAQVAQTVLLGLEVQGGSVDDAEFARAAAALEPGSPVAPEIFQAALAAVRLTDRFRKVDGQLLPGPGGDRAVLQLDPWPAVKRLEWSGDARRKEVRAFIRGLRKGMHPGDQRLAAWCGDLQTRLVEAGHPEARVAWARGDGDRTLVVSVNLGKPALVRQVDLVGDPAPYTRRDILKASGLEPGRSLWSQPAQLAAVRGLRRMFHNHHRFEATVEVAWDGDGGVRLAIRPGPRVNLAEAGDRLGRGANLKELVPLARADRYTPELLDEGDRLIVRHLRSLGYLDAQVTHRREVTNYPGTPFEEVTVTYTLHKGRQSHLDELRFEGNTAVSEADLRGAAAIHGGLLAPRITPDLLDALEDRVKGVYLSRGFTDTSLRRQMERQDGRTALVMRVREGPQRLVPNLRLELPPGGLGDPWSLGECLALIFADAPARGPVTSDSRAFASDRPAMAGVKGTLDLLPEAPGAPMVMTFTLSRPIPLLKTDLARVYTALKQQRLPALGLVHPVVRLTLEPGPDGSTGVRLEVPAQPVERIRRLVVTGSDKTRSEAVLRETRLQPGAPLDTEQLSRAQARLNTLGTFQRVDMRSLAPGTEEAGQASAAGPTPAWRPGDLQLTVEERPPYVVTNSFGYDKSQGYHVGASLQQLNVGGMGRTLDYGIRAGNGTIHNPTLARLFPTGAYDRSVDSFTVAYTDPWFAPGVLRQWLPDRTQSRSEGGYIEERRDLYILHRRRFTSALQWSLTPRVAMSVGYRWERTDVVPGVKGIDAADLAIYARYPRNSIVSAPYAQVARDTRDNSFDPTSGMYSVARVEFANQLFLTSPNSSFVKVDLKNQWTWPVGRKARAGVVAFGVHLGVARHTARTAENLPLAERFFAGGPFSYRGVEPDALGAQARVPKRDANGVQIVDGSGNPIFYPTPVGGQGLVLLNLEYRFPFLGKSIWGEVFADSGQVYQYLSMPHPVKDSTGADVPFAGPLRPPLRTALGVGLIFKIGIPLKIEYAADIRRILGWPRSQDDRDTQLKSLLVSAGFQF